MNDALNYYREINRLQNRLDEFSGYPREASWLLSPFDDDTWLGSFKGFHKISVNFAVRLEDGSLLTDPKNSELLTFIKAWLCVQGTASPRTGAIPDAPYLYRRVTICFSLIDYFLLRAPQFQLAKFGFGLVTENDIQSLFASIASSNQVSFSIYEWPKRLLAFLREGAANLELEPVLKRDPWLAEFECEDSWFSNAIERHEIVRFRAFLWSEGYWRRNSTHTQSRGFRYYPDTKAISAALYKNTLRGVTDKPTPAELRFKPIRSVKQEMPAVPVKFQEMSKRHARDIRAHESVLSYCDFLHSFEVNFPIGTRQGVSGIAKRQQHAARPIGRFSTLPPEVVLKALRQAIEFYLKFGDGIASTYVNLAQAISRVDDRPCASLKGRALANLICPTLRELDIQVWDLAYSPDGRKDTPGRRVVTEAGRYFEEVRRGVSFWHLLMVLYGCVTITLGTLMARRVSELFDLHAMRCVDTLGRYLLFRNAKSAGLGMRQLEARPIPEIAVRMIRTIQTIQTGLIECGVLEDYTYLLSWPRRLKIGLSARERRSSDKVLDIFCDYFEVSCDKQGRRYYFRVHQLRRFFAMAFFWCGTPGGPDTLRWFLGHTDLRHLYHYITESNTGDVLNSVRASVSSELVQRDDISVAALAELCEVRFGTRNFSVLSSGELEEYIEELILEGAVTVEPVFFGDANRERYNIVISVKEK